MQLFETMLALALGVVVLAGLSTLARSLEERRGDAVASADCLRVEQACRAYMAAHVHELLLSCQEEDGVEMSTEHGIPAELAPYLPGHTGKNPNGLFYRLRVRRQEIAGERAALLCFLTLEGRVLSEPRLRGIVANCVGAGSFVAGLVRDNVFRAASTRLSLERWGMTIPDPTVCLIVRFLDQTAWARAYGTQVLARQDIPGAPELNRMETHLDMSGHALANVGALQFRAGATEDCTAQETGSLRIHEDGSLRLCRAGNGGFAWQRLHDSTWPELRDVRVLTDGATLDKPACSQGEAVLIVVPMAGKNTPVSIEDLGTQWRVRGEGSLQALSLCRALP